MKFHALFFGLIACAGCSRKPTTTLEPVPVPPSKVTLPPRPIYESARLDGTQTTQQKLKWMADDFGACRAAEEQYRQLLSPFVNNPDPKPAP